MARKTTLELLQEAIANGNMDKAQELSKKLKAPPKAKKGSKKKELIIAPAEILEEPIAKPKSQGTLKRVPAVHEAADEGVRFQRVPASRRRATGMGERQMTIAPFVPRPMNGWKDSGVEERQDSVKTNKDFGTQRITERTRPPATQVEVECDKCGHWFVIYESQLALKAGSNWRCSKCCTKG